MHYRTKWRGFAALALIAAAVACSDRNSSPPTTVKTAAAVAGDDALERVPVTASRGGDGACDWSSAAVGKTQTLSEKYRAKGRPVSITLERDNAKCAGSIVVRPLPADFLKRLKWTKIIPTKGDSSGPTVQGYEQTRAYCRNTLIPAQGIPGHYTTGQGIIVNGSNPPEYLGYFVLDIYTRRVNVGGNQGMNCVKVDSLFTGQWSDDTHMWQTDATSPSPASDNPPFTFKIANQAPGGPSGWLDNAWCAGGTCLASLYVGAYKSFYVYCPWLGESEAHTFSDFNGFTWPAYYYIHARTDGILQVAGWGGSAHGYPGTFTTCAQATGIPLDLAYNVIQS